MSEEASAMRTDRTSNSEFCKALNLTNGEKVGKTLIPDLTASDRMALVSSLLIQE